MVNGSALDGGYAELRCVAVMGSMTVHVGPDVEVEAVGIGVLGAFEQHGSQTHRKGAAS